jgi:transcriptional regulator with XRE-family HTH domain
MKAAQLSDLRPIGALLREWRVRRRLSREALAEAVGVPGRSLALIESGRERPGAELAAALAERLELAPRERDAFVAAAGHPPAPDDGLDAVAREALERLLTAHEPFPALALDRGWTLVAANAALGLLTRDVAPSLLEPPVNVLRLALDPAGMARSVLDPAGWRSRLVGVLRRQVERTADPALGALAAEFPPAGEAPAAETLRIRSAYGTLAFLPAVTTFPTAGSLVAAELAIVTLHPVDARTRAAARAASLRPSGR